MVQITLEGRVPPKTVVIMVIEEAEKLLDIKFITPRNG